MAWFSSASTNDQLVHNMQRLGVISNERVAAAMKAVDRGDFVNMGPYLDQPQSIGYNATISAPHMHAYALDTLASCLKPGAKALDVGSGSGYLAVCMAKMVGPTGKVIGIEHIPELVDQSIKNASKRHTQLLESKAIELIVGDGYKGYEAEAPFDCIHVGAAAQEIPQALCDQLKPEGQLFIPVGPFGYQEIKVVTKKTDHTLEIASLMPVSFVPLTTPEKQLDPWSWSKET